MKEPVYVHGHGGLIGSNLVKLGARASDNNYYPNVINCVGFTDVDACEVKINASLYSNITYPLCVISRIDQQTHFTHISTDFIFNGDKGPYAENAAPSPLNVYGMQKLISERGVLEFHPNSLIIRTTCVYGWHAKKQTFAHWVKAQCEKGEPFVVTSEQFTTPIYAPDLARIILELVERGITGIVNVTSHDDAIQPFGISRYYFAKLIASAFGYDNKLIVPGGTVNQGARRPKLGGLVTNKLRSLGIVPQATEESLKDMVKTWGK